MPKKTQDLSACFGLCMNYVEDLDAYFCLSTSYMKDMVADVNYNLVVLVLPCRDVEERLYCNKMVVLVLPCRDVEEELYCNKMVVLVLPCRDVKGGALLQQDGGAGSPVQGCGRRSSTPTR